MVKIVVFFLALCTACVTSTAHSIHAAKADNEQISYINHEALQTDPAVQLQLSAQPAWKTFTARNGEWAVRFDERSAKPHRAFGSATRTMDAPDLESQARQFMSEELAVFGIDPQNFRLQNLRSSAKYRFADFIQIHNGLEVLNSNVKVRLLPNGGVVMFGIDAFDDIEVDTKPSLDREQLAEGARKFFGGEVYGIEFAEEPKILPTPQEHTYNYRLVYQATAVAGDVAGEAREYTLLVDAHSGVVWYKQVVNPHVGARDIIVQGSLLTEGPVAEPELLPLANIRLEIDGEEYFTDAEGRIDYDGPTPVQATVHMEGRWVKTIDSDNGGRTPSFDITIEETTDVITLDDGIDQHFLTAYHHTDIVHEYVKSFLPDFRAIDRPLTVNLDVTRDPFNQPMACNAFYWPNDGSINFNREDAQCESFGAVPSIVYHEYGHVMTIEFYEENGATFQNSALGEGYSDVLAFGLTHDPVLGRGASKTGTPPIRRYDQGDKVYPQDVNFDPHVTGEIIAGAWWHLAEEINSIPDMMAIFMESLYGMANGPAGSEGQVYSDALLDALFADDDDGDLGNGSPNFDAIISSFERHGITLNLAQTNLTHRERDLAVNEGGATITVRASTPKNIGDIVFRGDVRVNYKINGVGDWKTTTVQPNGNGGLEAALENVTAGAIVTYYFEADDRNGNPLVQLPERIDEGNVPFVALAGYTRRIDENFEQGRGDWQLGDNSDDAISGQWIVADPVSSVDFFDGRIIQPENDHSEVGVLCAVTGNGNPATDFPPPLPSDEDVDGGKTTLYSPLLDLSDYQEPAISYHRWYTNDAQVQFINEDDAENDFWVVSITNDGQNWVDVENTRIGERAWRRIAFRVKDYVEPSAAVQLRFVASDESAPSIIEAAVDDLQTFDLGVVSVAENAAPRVQANIYPNPAREQLFVTLENALDPAVTLELYTLLGRKAMSVTTAVDGNGMVTLDTGALDAGIYLLNIRSTQSSVARRIAVVK